MSVDTGLCAQSPEHNRPADAVSTTRTADPMQQPRAHQDDKITPRVEVHRKEYRCVDDQAGGVRTDSKRIDLFADARAHPRMYDRLELRQSLWIAKYDPAQLTPIDGVALSQYRVPERSYHRTVLSRKRTVTDRVDI